MKTFRTLCAMAPVAGLLFMTAIPAPAQSTDPPKEQEDVTVLKYNGGKKIVIKLDGEAIESDVVFDAMLEGTDFDDPNATIHWTRVLREASFAYSAELRQMETKSREFANKARHAEGEAADEFERALRDHLEAIFAYKQAMRQERLTKLRAELDAAEGEIEEREASREEIIGRRFEELIGRRKYKW